MNKEFVFIDNPGDLAEICQQLADSKWLAVDTEFERVRTYYPELCLLQLANQETTAIIDPLAINDLDVLYQLLYQESITKVFHAARQDLEIFFNLKAKIPMPVFDTQIAARFLEFDDQIGYANLVKEILGIELAKAHTRTDWKRRPLKQSHLRYAADDVIYLGEMYELLLERTEELDKDLYSNMKQQMLALDDLNIYQTNPDKMWKKIYESRRFKGEKLSVLKKLAAWRECMARQENQPRKWFMSNQVIVHLTDSLPEDETELYRIKGIDKKMIKRHGADLLEVIKEAQTFDVANTN